MRTQDKKEYESRTAKREAEASDKYRKGWRRCFKWWKQPIERFSGLLFIATVGLTIVAANQLSDMRLDRRPWIGIFTVKIDPNPIKTGEQVVITPILKNTGRTPALNWTAAFDPPIIQKDETGITDRVRCGAGCSHGLLVSNAEFPITITIAAATMTDEMVGAIQTGEKTIFIRGRTEYLDGSGDHHQTLICMFYNPVGHAFGYCARKESNYAD